MVTGEEEASEVSVRAPEAKLMGEWRPTCGLAGVALGSIDMLLLNIISYLALT